MSKYYEVKDDIENICLDCHHVGFTHATENTLLKYLAKIFLVMT